MEAPFKRNQKVVFTNNYVPNGSAKFKMPEIGCVGYVEDIFLDQINDRSNVMEWYIKFSEWPGYIILAKKFSPLPEQRERINYVAVSETLREKAIETVITQTN